MFKNKLLRSKRTVGGLLAGIILVPMLAKQAAAPTASDFHVADAFSTGWMLQDTNGDGIADFINGKIVVPSNPSATENAAAANFAARLGFGTTGLTPPIVVSSAQDSGLSHRIWIGKESVPSSLRSQIAADAQRLQANEGGVFAVSGGLVVLGKDDAGLTTAADEFSARAPFIWKTPGESLLAIGREIDKSAPPELEGVTYLKGKAGINRAFIRTASGITQESLTSALKAPHLNTVHELIVIRAGKELSAVNSKPLPTEPATPAAGAGNSGADAANASGGGANGAEAATPPPFDLGNAYTLHGLFKGVPKMPVPSSLDSQLSVPAGAAGIAMANLAARMGLETTGLTLPLAKADTSISPKDVKVKAVVVESSALGKQAEKKFEAEGNHSAPLGPSEGELRVVDRVFGKQPAILVRGDTAGSTAALDLLADRLPNLWETGKQYAALDELRYDLHRFFSLRSASGQAAVSMYHLTRWLDEIKHAGPGTKDLKAEVYVDVADPQLSDFVKKQIATELPGVPAEVEVGSLHAGVRCCAENPALHYVEPGVSFHQGKPTFVEDLTIPWEGTRLLNTVRQALPDVNRDQPVTLIARVSEGPDVRRKLKSELTEMLTTHGTAANRMDVEVLCAYKQGYSWLMDEIAPKLEGKGVVRMKIEFAKDIDPTGVRVMYSHARWIQELYPVDEMLAKALSIPLKNISFSEFDPGPGTPTYRVHAYNSAGAEIANEPFTVTTAMRAYSGVIPRYEQVQVDTGWVHLKAGSSVILDKRIQTDIEEFWDHYQDETLPKVFHDIMAKAKGDLRPEYAPPFDTLRLDIHMSEPDYSIGLDKERISSLEALQEDTFYSTENFIDMVGNLEAGHPINYVGRIIPVVHHSDDGQDGHVHIEYYGKPAGNPVVRLSWTDAQGNHHENERDLPVVAGPMEPRLIGARIRNQADAIEELTWELPADYREDKFNDWIKLEPQDQVERTIFSVEQARGQVHWLAEMHTSGLYRDEIAYPHLQNMQFEFELPRPLTVKVATPAPRESVAWAIRPPADPRPMIASYAAADPEVANRKPLVQWNEPISPDENAAILAKLAQYPGVNVYWMGRSYLGRDIWAADVMLPSPSQLRSWAKETTLKASILYSGRQHANEVSSTSHIDRLGDELVTDPATRAMLKHVNVILHPIDNPDGAQLSIELAKITPDNLLHPGYHGSLAADVSAGQAEPDPVYPESRTRRQLLESWLPDAFLNPHGYPSHEWVQPFSEYTGWVQSREGANPGRAWWIPRGWFTSLNYIRDQDHPYSEKVTYEIRDRIVAAEREVPGLLSLEERMNDRYERFGQRWQPKDMTQPIVDGIRIYMSLKGMPARAGAAARSGSATGGVSPDITWDSGYTEAPDETAHGDYMKLMASAGLAFDRVHLTYLAEGKLRIRRTEHEADGKVTWQVQRDRPNLPASEVTAEKPKPE
ncbi:MAG TPA: M14 family zinc carboxypeptidase [Bryobacteraceae bacterium]|nr:M14 family zinc carboxypeptidase [Bryobacteraceae bacterium]